MKLEISDLSELLAYAHAVIASTLEGAKLMESASGRGDAAESAAFAWAHKAKQCLRRLEKPQGESEEVRLALALELGLMLVAMQAVRHVPASRLGDHFRVKHNARKEKPSREVLRAFIEDELGRHGQLTQARRAAAKRFNVHPDTIRNWEASYQIYFPKS